MALNINETYISVEDAQDYAALMGLELPTGDELELLLRRAALYLDRFYGQRYLGLPLTTQQLLFWPRDTNDGLIPAALGQAQVELAALMFANGGTLPLASPRIKKKSVTLDEMKTDIEYADPDGYGFNPYSGIEMMLAPYFKVETVTGEVLKPRLRMTRGA